MKIFNESEDMLTFYYNMLSPFKMIQQNYTILIISYEGDINIDGNISGSGIGLFGNNIVVNKSSNIDAQGGCLQDQGPGRGLSFYYGSVNCAGSGGSSAGYGGVGISVDGVDSECKKLVDSGRQVMNIMPHNNRDFKYSGGSGGGR